MHYLFGMAHYVPQIGDMISIDRFGYKHVGIYVGMRGHGANDVVHNDKGGGVVVASLADFSKGATIHLHKAASGDYFQREAIASRAFSLVGRKFDLFTFNCEHAANWAQTGRLCHSTPFASGHGA